MHTRAYKKYGIFADITNFNGQGSNPDIVKRGKIFY